MFQCQETIVARITAGHRAIGAKGSVVSTGCPLTAACCCTRVGLGSNLVWWLAHSRCSWCLMRS